MRRPPTVAVPLLDDPVHRYVVEHTDGPLLVVGGPGTGKTTILVEAVAARIAAGVDPERILVLTFGRRGAAALRDRIEARIAHDAGRIVHEPLVRSFHAYAFGLLRRAAAERGEPSPRLLTGPEQDLIIRELLAVVADPAATDQVGWPHSLRSALPTRAFAQQLRDLMQRAAERGVGPVQLAQLGEQLGRDDWPAAARFLREYVAVLTLRDVTTRDSAAYDPAELVRAAAGLLADDPALLAAERRRVEFVFVDELADTDPAQVELLSLVAGGGKALIAFGDPDSSVYGFRGADPEAVTAFTARFRTAAGAVAERITLHTNYRAAPPLLSATSRVARRMRGAITHRPMHPPGAPATNAAPLIDAEPAGAAEPAANAELQGDTPTSTASASPVDAGFAAGAGVRIFRSATSEAAFVAHALREANLVHGVPWSQMAVVLRSTSLQLPSLQRALAAAGVPTVTHAEDLPLHLQPAVAPFLLLLRCALQPDSLDEEAAVALLHSPLGGADPLAERRLRQGLRALALAAGDRRPSGELLVDAVRDPAGLDLVERRWAVPAQTVSRLIATARAVAATPSATAEQVLWAVWQASGLSDRWFALSTRSGPAPDNEQAGRARHWRSEAADRDLDSMVVLFDAAARFVDRLPGARTEVFLDHVLGQDLPADSIAPSADRGDAVRLLTAHAAKGLEWDVVVLAGVQEGVWPDLRLRGSLLGSERLVDLLAGRAVGGPASTVGQTSALLDEERRLFYVATTRARRRLLVTAVAAAGVGDSAGDEQPSRFLAELQAEKVDAEGDNELPVGHPPRALTLAALVAELRSVVVGPDQQPGRRHAAAVELARLAAVGVPGAHPDQWWGLRSLSDDRPLAADGEPVTVTPSSMDSALRCSLRWLLERHGGAAPAGAAQGIGNLVHAAAMLAEDANADREKLVEYVSARFDAIELAARWLAGPEHERAQGMVDKLLRWLAVNPRRLLAIEHEFSVRLEDPHRPIQLTGRVDRLEIDEQGRLVVIDLKTGKTTTVAADIDEHAQLAGYQAAVDAGAFEEYGQLSGGAALVQLGTAKDAREQLQLPLSEAADPQWAYDMVRRTAETMAAATFAAVANSKCRVCPVRTSCPISGQGRQVVDLGLPTQKRGESA